MPGQSGACTMSKSYSNPALIPALSRAVLHAEVADTALVSPGEHRLAGADGVIGTRVGAAVCVAARDPVLGIGGITTLLLPPDNDRSAWMPVSSASLRLGNLMVEHLLTDLYKQGGIRQRFRLAVFGAAPIGEAVSEAARHNHAFLRTFLDLEKLAVSRVELGGLSARQVVYRPSTGEIRVVPLGQDETADVLAAEAAYLSGRAAGATDSDVELF